MQENYQTLGHRLVESGIHGSQIAIDLDETLWEWSSPILRQPTLLWEHREYVFVRRPLLWLLEGIVQKSQERLSAWTSGYGYRLDRICEQLPSVAALLHYDPSIGQQSETLPNVFTRMDLARALEQDPSLIPPVEGRLASQKIPHTPTAAGKPLVDAARILLDDKERNCRRFVSAGDQRSAIWLRGTPRLTRNTLPIFSVPTSGHRCWADGVADALGEIASGKSGLFIVDSVESEHINEAVCVHLPHRRFWREWLAPSNQIKRLQAKL
ncbi:MAG TPA: hypothetical protein EYN06_00855 [Myxococcales bacterium]|nr:hypothetical protein [Myxococcales bacterium]HIN84998.1 hypothetical protein [Myxococcales bacterium]